MVGHALRFPGILHSLVAVALPRRLSCLCRQVYILTPLIRHLCHEQSSHRPMQTSHLLRSIRRLACTRSGKTSHPTVAPLLRKTPVSCRCSFVKVWRGPDLNWLAQVAVVGCVMPCSHTQTARSRRSSHCGITGSPVDSAPLACQFRPNLLRGVLFRNLHYPYSARLRIFFLACVSRRYRAINSAHKSTSAFSLCPFSP